MRQYRQQLVIAALGALFLSSCHASPVGFSSLQPLQALAPLSPQVVAESHGKPPKPPHGNLPPASSFVVVQGTCIKVLPADNSGLKHQNWQIKETSPNAGMVLTVNNDVDFGQSVPGLTVGMVMTIKGVTYHDAHSDGIHWTHHSEDPAIGGFIKLANGQIFQ